MCSTSTISTSKKPLRPPLVIIRFSLIQKSNSVIQFAPNYLTKQINTALIVYMTQVSLLIDFYVLLNLM